MIETTFLSTQYVSLGSFVGQLIFVVNVVMAMWTFVDAFSWEQDGRHPMMWTVVVFLLSIAGLFLYLMLGRSPSFQAADGRQSKT
ncbi:hypothetical protein C479_05448 [Halovivax asiaticus JCM 14624]|uniref:Cardiolipin synthase N-terminal domain-containing protein n=1 Tax=Halovivax asiaticus JCM 14624 TaxID=1227490 RepID=M0BP15_9EURY|nr:PLDc N-terminal domain-containing protein [Halovivax asiaticus]ELZ12227.1 hypothetical protein C479_05448 [Halovivax asiaticus JCM 14624]